jgi:hypothetical protein
MVTPMELDLATAVDRLRGLACWGTVAGGSAGSAVALDFGGRRPRAKPLRRPHLTPEQQELEGEVSMLVHCAWRLETSAAIVCGSGDDNGPDGPMLRGLTNVVGATVQHVESLCDGRDLVLTFDRDLTLRVFCDNTVPDQWSWNYTIFVDGQNVSR